MELAIYLHKTYAVTMLVTKYLNKRNNFFLHKKHNISSLPVPTVGTYKQFVLVLWFSSDSVISDWTDESNVSLGE